MKISLIIPAHNEAKRITQTLTEYIIFLRQQFPSNFEIIVVVNGSTDQTAQLVNDFKINNPEVIFISDSVAAKGRAVRLGFAKACGEWVSFVDADNAIPPQEWLKLFLALGNELDGAIASRFLPESKVVNRTPFRRFAGQIFSGFVHCLFGMNFHDTQCGAKIIRGSKLAQVLPVLRIDNMAFDVELLWHLARTGAKIKEIPINWQGGEAGAVARPGKFIKQTIMMVWSLFVIRLFS